MVGKIGANWRSIVKAGITWLYILTIERKAEKDVSESDADKGCGLVSVPSYFLSLIQHQSRSVSVSVIS